MNDETIIKDNKINILSIVEDNSGGLSSTRILMLSWGLVVLAVWAFGSITATIHNKPQPTLDSSVVTITLGITGVKAVQRFGEK